MKFYILFSIFLFVGTCYGRQRKGDVNEEPKNQQDLKKRDRDGKCTYYLTYRKSLIRSRPLIQVYSIRGRAIGGSVQALIIGKSLNPSKLPYLELYELLQMKNFALEIVIFEVPLIQV